MLLRLYTSSKKPSAEWNLTILYVLFAALRAANSTQKKFLAAAGEIKQSRKVFYTGTYMNILVDADTSGCQNMGDVAMLQVAVARLRALWPDASIHVITSAPRALAVYCPGVVPVAHLSQYGWLADDYLIGPLRRLLPVSMRYQLGKLKRLLGWHWPALVALMLRLRFWLSGQHSDPHAFPKAMSEADLFVVSGMGGLNDSFQHHAGVVLDTLDFALRRGIPTALFSQGIGPADQPELRAKLKAVLPRVSLIALREDRIGGALLESLGVAPDRMVTTGDDAIELAYETRAAQPGDRIGVNLRISPNAAVDDTYIGKVRAPLHAFARAQGVSLVPVPISTHEPRTIRQVLAGSTAVTDGGATLDTPRKIMEQLQSCRIVVTGAYHAAVFALAQGIPCVCLAKSAYFVSKFSGLAHQFGAGCEIVMLDDPELAQNLEDAMERAWASAESIRPQLLAAAEQQIGLSRAAYGRLYSLVADQAAPLEHLSTSNVLHQTS